MDEKTLADPRGILLEYQDVEELLQRMGFIGSLEQRRDQEFQELKDMYTVFKCGKDQKILAENLQTLLLGISGIEASDMTIENLGKEPLRWNLAGAYQKDTGVFFLREGET